MSGPAGARSQLPSERDVLAQARAENFPVALRVLPRRHREHLMAVYGYARLVDDTGDELDGGPPERLAALDDVEAELDRACAGTATHPVFVRLSATIAACGLERAQLGRLIEASRMDQRVSTYATFDDLLGYCGLSADPVGRLVLAVFGCGGTERARLSDLVCSALQLIEHAQDVVEDAHAGRVYLPNEELEAFGVEVGSLATHRSGTPAPPEFRRLMALQISRASRMLDEGSGLVSLVPGWARLAIAGFAGGGRAQIEAIERARYDVLSGPVQATDLAVARHALALWARGARR